MRTSSQLIALCAVSVCASNVRGDDFAPGPPPDPSQGERADGKVSDSRQYGDLLVVPRLILTPFRVLERGIEVPVHGLLDLDAKYHWIEKLTHILQSEDGKRGVRPGFRYISRFDPQLGITYFDRKTLGPGSSMDFTFGAVLPALVFGDAHISPRLPNPYHFTFHGTYLNRNDELFAGVGPASTGGLMIAQVPLSHVQIRAVNISSTLTLKLHTLVHVHATQGWSFRHYGPGSNDTDRPNIVDVYCEQQLGGCLFPKVDPARVPGYYTGADYFWEEVGFTFDTRGGSFSDRYWLRLIGNARYNESAASGGSPMWMREHFTVDGGFPLGGHTRRLVLKLSVDLLQPLAGSTVPFSELIVVGGPDDFRGAPIGRFHDYSSILATVEYRWAVWMWMDAAVFNDWVGVFGRNFSGFGIDRFVPDVGAGLVLHTKSAFLMRLQVAYGPGSGIETMFATTAGF